MAKLTIAGIEYEGTPEEIREMVEAVNTIAKAGETDEEPTPKTITHEGADYALVDRKAQAGDVVEFTTRQVYFTKGKTYGPVNSRDEVRDDEGDELDVYRGVSGRTSNSVLVYEKVADEFVKFTDGAKVRLISGGGDYPLRGFDDGREYEVVMTKYAHGEGDRVQIETAAGKPGYAKPSQLEIITGDTLKVGDKVEVIDGSKSNYGDFPTGTVGEITRINERYAGTPYRVDTEDDYDRFPADALRKVEEKPREYRYGDIVKGYGIHVDHEVIGIVEDVGTSLLGVQFNGNRYTAIEDFELIAPVESRVDTK